MNVNDIIWSEDCAKNRFMSNAFLFFSEMGPR